MKILQIRGSFEDNGPGTQTLTISEELRRRGHVVELCSSGGLLADKITSKGFNLHIIPELAFDKRSFFNVLKSVYKLCKVLKKNNFEIIHAHNAATVYISFFATLLIGHSKRIKLFHSCRGVELRPLFQWRNFIYKIYPAHLFAVCQFTKNKLLSFGVLDSKITITYNGVDTNRFDINQLNSNRVKMRKELNIPIDAFVVGIIGRMEVKGHDLLIKAFANLYDIYPNLYIVLVGAGPDFQKNLNLAKKLKVENRTIFTGFRTDSELMNAGFDIFALLSTNGEMFPNAILESMAYKHTFIASNLSGIPEMAKNGEGFIVPIADIGAISSHIELLMNNLVLRNSMGEKAYKSIITIFNIKIVVDKILDAYHA
jgi:glycosyltransferase involved in cell wall biosynthesis